jgi:hypothetical protein
MLNTALSPLAMSRNARPPVRRSSEARNEAITCGSRVRGLLGRSPTAARGAASAISVART